MENTDITNTFAAIKSNLNIITKQQQIINDKIINSPNAAPQIQQDIINKLPHCLFLVNNTVYEKQWVIAKCERGHIHKYSIIHLAKNKVKSCITCSSGTVFMKNTRLLIEDCLEAPIALRCGAHVRQFWNPIYKLYIVYPVGACENNIVNDGGKITLTLSHTSMSKAIHTICKGLRQISSLSAKQHTNIDNLFASSSQSKLVLSSAMSSLLYGESNDIENDQLYIENCIDQK